MSSLHQSRARVLFDSACAFGLAASSAFAWMQTYATAFLPMAGIAGMWGLARLLDMRQSSEHAAEPVAVTRSVPEPVVTFEPEPVAVEPEPVAVEPPAYVQPPMEDVLATVKRSRKATKPPKARKAPVQEVVEQAAPEPQPVVDEPVALELEAPLMLDQATAEVVQHPAQAAPEEPEADYAPPVVPLFEAEPFVRTQRRTAFGRKAG